ncbi:hypothetical protein ACLOJK_014324 [Asimina triloba]
MERSQSHNQRSESGCFPKETEQLSVSCLCERRLRKVIDRDLQTNLHQLSVSPPQKRSASNRVTCGIGGLELKKIFSLSLTLSLSQSPHQVASSLATIPSVDLVGISVKFGVGGECSSTNW